MEIIELKQNKIENKNKELFQLLENNFNIAIKDNIILKNKEDIYKYNNSLKSILEPIFKWLEKDIEVYFENILVKYITDNINLYIKNIWKYPNYKTKEFQTIIKQLNLKENDFLKLIINHLKKNIEKDWKGSVKMKKIFAETFINNEDLFIKFFIINNLEYKKAKEFEDIWKNVNKLLKQIENDLLKHMENWKYWEMSSSVNDKFQKYIKIYFPLIDKVWVIVRKLSKKEMEEYIKNNNK